VREMTRRDWWLGAILTAAALTVHALLPRYEGADPGGDNQRLFIRIDRWTGEAHLGLFGDPRSGGVWGR